MAPRETEHVLVKLLLIVLAVAAIGAFIAVEVNGANANNRAYTQAVKTLDPTDCANGPPC